MRTIVIVTALLALSTILPAGFLLGRSYFDPESASQVQPQEPRAMIPVQPPQEAVKKEDVLEKVVELPKQEAIIQPPQPAIVAQPPQQPIREPQIPQLQQISVIEVRPRGYVFKGALLSIHRAEGDHAKDLVRAQLGDADLAPFLQVKGLHRDANRTISLKQAFQEIDARMSNWLSSCSPPNREIGNCPEKPFMYLELNEGQAVALVNLMNSPLNSTQWFREELHRDGDLERKWNSVITHNGIRYLILVITRWGP